MKKTALPFFVVAVLLLAGFGAWFALTRTERTGRAAQPRDRGAEAAPAPAEPEVALAEPVASEAPAPEETLPASALSAPEDSKEAARAAGESGGGRRIRGRVLVPAGSPADESLRVVAVREALAPRQVYGTGGVLADLAQGKKETCLGSAAVGADGSFSLPLSTADEVWLAVDGRFLFSGQLQRAPAAAETVDLPAELGGCLTGKVRLPKEGDATALRAQREAIELELSVDGENFSMASFGTAPLFPRRARLDDAGEFELRALPIGFPMALEARAEDFADAEVSGLEFEAGRVRAIEVALLEGATLRGTVRDEGGSAVAEAEVVAAESAIWGFPGEELAETKSDADGGFVLEHVAPGKCLLLAKKEGALESESLQLELSDREQRDGLALALGRGASISGSVRLPDGAPASGVDVEVSFDPEALVGMGAFNAARGGSSKTKSKGDGSFEATGLGKGPFVVSASLEREAADGAKEEWLAKAGHVKPDTHDLALVLAAPSAITGRVRDVAGQPVTKFQVRASMESAAFFLPGESKSQPCDDPEGDFVLRGLEAGSWKVEASADGFGPMTPVPLVLPRADESPLELVLAPAASIAGRVLEPNGSPAGGAKVTLQADNAQRMERLRGDVKPPETISAADGTFVLANLGGGTSTIYALRAGLAPSEPVAVETVAGQRAEGVVLTLRKGAVVTGEVYGRDGKPAASVRIVGQETGSWDTNMKNSDAEGRFRFEALAPGAWTISALLEGKDLTTGGSESETTAALLDNMRFAAVQLEDGEEEHVVLGAPPKDPVLVRGRALHGDEPVEGGLVSFFAEGSKGLEAFKMASLGADGGYEIELSAPGAYIVSVQITASGAAFQQNNVEFRETIPEVEEHRLDFALPLGSISGRVRGGDENALGGTRVTLATDGGIELGSMLGGQYSEATTDEEGRYTFEYLRPGTYTVAAGGALFGGAFGGKSQAGRVIRAGLHVEEGRLLEGVDFELDDAGKIEGRVVNGAGAPVKDATIFVRNEEGRLLDRLSMITSAADGTFKYGGVAEGQYVVSARGKGMASSESAPVRVPKAGSARVELVLQAGTKLVIEVVDAEGKPTKANVTVVDEHGREMHGMLGFAELAGGFADWDGSKQVVGPLSPGAYTVTASADGEKASKPVTLDGQPERRLKLRLR